ncbi:hypothetical protein [Pseudomaricurvus alkylphenolicus]|uniref:hypothetical protein n=1 Tax=Pseudomaricurvus alkylphenolicus TaxID=1306991 RepID=UPI00141F07B1|nr:hypothetical protein [Pseudomaricurvus alkylphenolicus]
MKYLLKKNGYWYRPKFCGYTSNLHEAGIYSEDEIADYRTERNCETRIVPCSEVVADLELTIAQCTERLEQFKAAIER